MLASCVAILLIAACDPLLVFTVMAQLLWCDADNSSESASPTSVRAEEGSPVIIRLWHMETCDVRTPLQPILGPTRPVPVDPPLLQLPRTQQRVGPPSNRERSWNLRYVRRCSRAEILQPGPSRWLLLILGSHWLSELRQRVRSVWLVDFMGVHLHLSLNCAEPWPCLRRMRHCLRAIWPSAWLLPGWLCSLLRAEPC